MKDLPPISYDPYDLWTTNIGVRAKRWFYQGQLAGKAASVLIALIDWLCPTIGRKLWRIKKRAYPISTALWILTQTQINRPDTLLASLTEMSNKQYGNSWGLGFPWMSKNGLYPKDMPFITHTPYVLEALLKLKAGSDSNNTIAPIIESVWNFMDSLKIMRESPDILALSYAPVDEPRIVINANAYACFAFTLFAETNINRAQAIKKATKIAKWIISQQEPSGAWYYYADRAKGNFIDCFHSCFVIKNLVKAGKIVPEIQSLSTPAIESGCNFIIDNFYVEKTGLVKRFFSRDIKDPFLWDIYDQAEFLGMLIDLGQIRFARTFSENITKTFQRGTSWYCRKDIFGRLWGRDFFRWGIAPFLYQQQRLRNINQDQV